MKYASLLIVLCIICSCATASGPSGAAAGVDWQALESAASATDVLQMKPEIEPVNLRISLLHVQTDLEGNHPQLLVGGNPLIRPFGVDLGNGLAIDAGGNVFLDPMKMLRIDTGAPFMIDRKPDSLLGSHTTLKRDSAGMTVKSPQARGAVVETEKGFAVKNAGGRDDIAVTLSEGSYEFKTSSMFEPSWHMAATDERLSITGTLQQPLRIDRDGESVLFNTASNPAFPQYVVTKQGDSYSILYKSTNALITFKIYFTRDTIYVMQNGMAAMTVKDTGSSILVNGKEAVTYSKG